MSLHFAAPAAFWLLLLIPFFIVLKVLADGRARRSVEKMASPRLLDGLLVRQGRGRAWVVFSLELLALILFIGALARPQYGSTVEEEPGSGRSLIIAVDTSKSMLAEDVAPNRLERAKLAAEDLVKKLRRDRIGLMAFAGTAFMSAPITSDTDAVLEYIQAMDTDEMPREGSNMARAIDKAVETFKRAELSGQQAMILFSDGEELEGEALAAAKRAREAKIAIVCVAVGTLGGEMIPDRAAPGGFHRDRDGKIVLTRLQRDVLVRIADITGGLYLTLDGPGISDSRIDLILSKLERSAMKSKITETAVDRYRWPLAAGLGCLTAAYLTGIVRRHRSRLAGPSAALAAAAGLVIMTGWPDSLTAREAGALLPPAETKGVPAAPGEAADRAREEKPAKQTPPAPKAGDPWEFYYNGDWANSVYNFGLERKKVRSEAEIDRVEMGRGVAAFKAATADAEKFDIVMMETAMQAFGTALSSGNATVRENAHYNLANAIFERAKGAERQRAIAEAKAKSKKAKQKNSLTLTYLDGLIRQLENSLEHYQETLVLNADHTAARNNHAAVAELVKKLREVREAKAQLQQQSKKGKGKKQKGQSGQGEEESEGEGEGEGEGQGRGKGRGKGQGSGEEEEGEGDEGEEEGEGGEGEEEGKGKGQGEEGGDGSGGEDESNEEFDGNAGASGDTGGEENDGGGKEDGESEVDGMGTPRGDAISRLKNHSQELGVRPRTQSTPERRPAKDW